MGTELDVGLHLGGKADLWLTYPTATNDGLPNPFQVKVLKTPDSSTQNHPKGAVRERMHGRIYAAKNDAKGV